MKLILKQKTVAEAELKSSDTLKYTAQYGIPAQIAKGILAGSTAVNVPIRELVYSKSKPFTIGAILYYFGNILGEKLKNNPTLTASWVPEERNFSKNFIEKMLDEKFPIALSYAAFGNDASALGSTGFRGTSKGLVIPGVDVAPFKHKDPQDMDTTVRHEAQHVTQIFGDYCLYHYELLKRAGFDFSKIEEPNYTQDVLKPSSKPYIKNIVGRGRMPLRSPPQTAFAYDPNLSSQENEKRFEEFTRIYFRDDAEFETWTSDLAIRCIRFALEEGELTTGEMLGGYLATKFPMFAGTRLTEQGLRDIKALKQIALDINIPYDRLRNMIKRNQSLSQLAISIARNLTENEFLMERIVAAYMGNKALKSALQALPKIRPKEFMRDFALRIEEELKQKIEEKYPNLKNY